MFSILSLLFWLFFRLFYSTTIATDLFVCTHIVLPLLFLYYSLIFVFLRKLTKNSENIKIFFSSIFFFIIFATTRLKVSLATLEKQIKISISYNKKSINDKK